MLDPTKSRFWKSALQSGLLDEQSLSACWESIAPEKRDDEDHIDRRLGRQAVHLKYLTIWQAQQLLAGRFTGFKVDRYILLDLLGQGGMGRVYLARDSRLNRQVALKILSPERMNNPRAIARFQREARVGAQLQHENLVRLYDFGESQGRHFLVMELIEGKTLGFHIATQGKIMPAAVAQAGRQVALGLDHAHQKGLIHRDVNPYNVIVTHEGVAKLADMGLAMDLADEAKVTRDGATVGTFDYVAPEQARHSHAADIRSDVYSLGCTLYHALVGRVPFPQPGLAEKLFAHQSQEPEPLEDQVPEVPTGLADVVRKMMRKKPEDRFQTPGEVAAALLPFTRSGSPGAASLVVEAAGGAGAGSGDVLAVGATVEGTSGPEAAGPFPFNLDLGPRPSLSDSTRNPKAWFGGSGSKPSSGSGSTSASPSSELGSASATTSAEADAATAIRRRWFVAAVLLGIASAALAFEAVRRGKIRLWSSTPAVVADGPKSQDKGTGKAASRPAGEGPPAIDWGGASAVIRARDGTTRPAPDLSAALVAAVGGQGVVVIKGGEPLAVKADAARTLAARGTIEIEGEPGGKAVLRIELGAKPWLSTGSSVNLVLRNLTVEAYRAAPDEKSSPPIVLAAGRASFQHCAFRTAPALGYPGATAVVSKGGSLEIDGCWFEGFDSAVEIRAMAGVEHRIRGSMFVPGGTAVEADKAKLSVRRGWAVRSVLEGGGVRDGKRTVALANCTILGEGLLKMEGFTEATPLRMDVSSCVAKVERLLDASPPPWSPKALAWQGKANRFEVVGESWASGAAIANAGDWAKLYQEADLEDAAVRFTMEGKASDGHLPPEAYSLVGASGSPRGADPGGVGPRP